VGGGSSAAAAHLQHAFEKARLQLHLVHGNALLRTRETNQQHVRDDRSAGRRTPTRSARSNSGSHSLNFDE
jgi:hypothetical protein